MPRLSTKKPKDPNAPKSALSSYFLFSNERRDPLRGAHKALRLTEIAKMIATEWKSMNDEAKQPYIARAKEAKTVYAGKLAEYKQTDEFRQYQNTLAEWQATQQRLKAAKEGDGSGATKVVMPRRPKDKSAPKKPASSYFLFAQKVRPQVKSENVGMKITGLAKLIGAMWRQLSKEEKQPFQDEAVKLKEAYKVQMEAYNESEEAETYKVVLAEWKAECERRKRAHAARQDRMKAKEKSSKVESSKNKKKKRRRMEESSSESESSSDSGSSSGSESESSSGSGSDSGSSSGSDSDSD